MREKRFSSGRQTGGFQKEVPLHCTAKILGEDLVSLLSSRTGKMRRARQQRVSTIARQRRPSHGTVIAASVTCMLRQNRFRSAMRLRHRRTPASYRRAWHGVFGSAQRTPNSPLPLSPRSSGRSARGSLRRASSTMSYGRLRLAFGDGKNCPPRSTHKDNRTYGRSADAHRHTENCQMVDRVLDDQHEPAWVWLRYSGRQRHPN